MVDFLAGAVTLAFALAALFFLRFWKKTRDRLFLHFTIAFCLFAVNQIVVTSMGSVGEKEGYAYIFRVIGFLLILASIVDKNLKDSRK